jgi:hypothetical protein
MEAQANSLLSQITAAADSSESRTMLVSEGSGLPRNLQQAFDDCASLPSGISIVSYVRHISGICLTYSEFLHMPGIYLKYTSMPKAMISLVSMHVSIP